MIELAEDFIREFSVWQQQLEIEANLSTIKRDLGIKCSAFLFANFSDGRVTAFRIKNELLAIPYSYIKPASRKGFAKGLFHKIKPITENVRQTSTKYLQSIDRLDSTILAKLRQQIIELWPGYLYGYNLYRDFEKGLFEPKNQIEKDNLDWSIKMRNFSEGIYDCIESLLEKKLVGHFWQLLDKEEIYKLVDNKINTPPIRNLPFVVDKDGIHQLDFEKYMEKKGYFWKPEELDLSAPVKGMVAVRGRASGRVRIVSKRNPESFKNFIEGEVLVALSTSPQFVPLMKKAVAIVTSEGGLASHAAIVAREIKKPCIVGTKTVTKILKDGDLVEVDADKGIVIKISQ